MNTRKKMEVLRDLPYEHTQEDEVSRDLPNDVVIDILTRLPAKTLVRFRCVCKTWCDIIIDATFITMHNIYQSTKFHNYNRKNSKGHLMIELTLNYRPLSQLITVHPKGTLYVDYEKWELPLPLITVSTPHIDIVGSCNGLICLTHSTRDILLWNPSIRETKTLPSPNNRGSYRMNATTVHDQVLGFGFDCRTNDFKVVKFLYAKSKDNGICKVNVSLGEVEVYSLSTKSWKTITTIVPRFPTDFLARAFVNGAVHWKATKEGFKGELIMSFDFANEVFREILLPNCYMREHKDFFRIAEFQKSLSLLSCHFNGFSKSTCFVWVMKEYGMTESWTKQFTISLQCSGYDVEPLGFAMNGEVLLNNHGGKLVSYDPETQQINDLGIPVRDAVTYMESLALLTD